MFPCAPFEHLPDLFLFAHCSSLSGSPISVELSKTSLCNPADTAPESLLDPFTYAEAVATFNQLSQLRAEARCRGAICETVIEAQRYAYEMCPFHMSY